ncbi:MAG: hypothetical protein JWP91_4300 [Fibrobacteres bacterium]|nr:hypothetical protein [Fibrobacterota bacterium]
MKASLRILGVTLVAGLAIGAALIVTACSGAGKSGKSASPGDNGGSAAAAGAAGSSWKRTDAKVRIRLHNLDSLSLKGLFIRFPADSARFPVLAGRSYTDYIAVDSAYRYAYIHAVAGDGRAWICQPTDFVGESPLVPGRYTFELSRARLLDSTGKAPGFLRLELLQDKEHP